MDSRFIKSDKIDQKLRKLLYKYYYYVKELIEENDIGHMFEEKISFYGKKIKRNEGYAAIHIKDTVGLFYLSPDEINLFCSEYHIHFLGEFGCTVEKNI